MIFYDFIRTLTLQFIRTHEIATKDQYVRLASRIVPDIS